MWEEERKKVKEKSLDSVFSSLISLTLWKWVLFIFQDHQVCVFWLPSFIGYHCEAYNNPADFFLDIINGDSTAVALNREEDFKGIWICYSPRFLPNWIGWSLAMWWLIKMWLCEFLLVQSSDTSQHKYFVVCECCWCFWLIYKWEFI